MKRPYYSEDQRWDIKHKTTVGQFLLLELNWLKFKRELYYAVYGKKNKRIM